VVLATQGAATASTVSARDVAIVGQQPAGVQDRRPGALSTEHQEVLLECYFRGASIAEAAKTLGVPPGTIKSRTHDALHALRRALDEIVGLAG
jgi:DNA-binding NarL/FixJ family response regulator